MGVALLALPHLRPAESAKVLDEEMKMKMKTNEEERDERRWESPHMSWRVVRGVVRRAVCRACGSLVFVVRFSSLVGHSLVWLSGWWF